MALSDQTARYGGFWIRVLAGIIDSIILVVLLGIIAYIVGLIAPGFVMPQPHHMITGGNSIDFYTAAPGTQLINIVVGLLYYAILESSTWQASVGMKVCGLKITDDNYQKITFWRALGREIAAYLSAIILFIGYFMIGWTKRKQGLHDMIASTYVVRN